MFYKKKAAQKLLGSLVLIIELIIKCLSALL